MSSKPFLGRGWSFPPAFSDKAGTVIMVEAEDDIRESLSILLSTTLGERFLQPSYGCDLTRLLFEPLNTTLKTYLKDLIKTAVMYHEPRVKLLGADFSYDQELEGLVEVRLSYEIKATNSRINQVFPFYTNEGEFVTAATE
ncbi:MAG: GPW/gp25 family protein [Bacteroidota bacterium]